MIFRFSLTVRRILTITIKAIGIITTNKKAAYNMNCVKNQIKFLRPNATVPGFRVSAPKKAMRKLLFILLFLPFFSCNKDTAGINGPQLKEIRTANGIHQSFEYNNGLLTKENSYYGMCSTPVDEFVYLYQGGKLDKLETTMRSLYSSSMALCNPAAGIKSTEQYEYDSQGRISKATRQSSYTIFEYDANGHAIKQTLYDPAGTTSKTATFKYDSRGNVIEENDYQGNSWQYEYDNNSNPFYNMKKTQGWISAFSTSPNNIIKATRNGAPGFERKILSYQGGLPRIVLDNGVEYTYIYH